jgi:hypothetical protein
VTKVKRFCERPGFRPGERLDRSPSRPRASNSTPDYPVLQIDYLQSCRIVGTAISESVRALLWLFPRLPSGKTPENTPVKPLTAIPTIFCLIVSLSSCGGGSGSSGSSWDSSLNASGFPAVAGKYSFNTDKVTYTCSDGSSGTSGPIAQNATVDESANVLTIRNANEVGPTPGVTFLEKTVATGNIQHDAAFIVTRTARAQFADVSGVVTLNYVLTGQFSKSGWAGDYQLRANFPSHGVFCDYSTSFSGDKIA